MGLTYAGLRKHCVELPQCVALVKQGKSMQHQRARVTVHSAHNGYAKKVHCRTCWYQVIMNFRDEPGIQPELMVMNATALHTIIIPAYPVGSRPQASPNDSIASMTIVS